MAWRVSLAASAYRDVDAILAWFEAPGAAAVWLAEFEQACAGLCNLPMRGAIAAESRTLGKEIRQLLVGLYRVLYVVAPNAVTVLHVRHASRLPLSAEPLGP
jgi:plasmid stabilization system protein ParE